MRSGIWSCGGESQGEGVDGVGDLVLWGGRQGEGVDGVGDLVLALVADVGEGGVVVDEGRAREADAVEVEHEVDRIHLRVHIYHTYYIYC